MKKVITICILIFSTLTISCGLLSKKSTAEGYYNLEIKESHIYFELKDTLEGVILNYSYWKEKNDTNCIYFSHFLIMNIDNDEIIEVYSSETDELNYRKGQSCFLIPSNFSSKRFESYNKSECSSLILIYKNRQPIVSPLVTYETRHTYAKIIVPNSTPANYHEPN
ncbi:MAG: hypothetical protein N4A45_10870 [Flavobacteriales bacterium]|jgi:hypothetical protein|nr:hypothetical protein [Flavobacteriales bacterium]